MLAAITQAARAKGGLPTREDVVAALRRLHYQGIAYVRPVEWDAKGDNMAAVIFLNVVEGDRFKEVGEPRLARTARTPVERRDRHEARELAGGDILGAPLPDQVSSFDG